MRPRGEKPPLVVKSPTALHSQTSALFPVATLLIAFCGVQSTSELLNDLVLEETAVWLAWEEPGSRERVSLVTDRLKPLNGSTELTLIRENCPDEDARVSHLLGWNGLIDKLLVFFGDTA